MNSFYMIIEVMYRITMQISFKQDNQKRKGQALLSNFELVKGVVCQALGEKSP